MLLSVPWLRTPPGADDHPVRVIVAGDSQERRDRAAALLLSCPQVLLVAELDRLWDLLRVAPHLPTDLFVAACQPESREWQEVRRAWTAAHIPAPLTLVDERARRPVVDRLLRLALGAGRRLARPYHAGVPGAA